MCRVAWRKKWLLLYLAMIYLLSQLLKSRSPAKKLYTVNNNSTISYGIFPKTVENRNSRQENSGNNLNIGYFSNDQISTFDLRKNDYLQYLKIPPSCPCCVGSVAEEKRREIQIP